MWIAIKIKKHSEINLIKGSLIRLLGNQSLYCMPKIKSHKFTRSKSISNDFYLLGKYILIYNKRFSENNILSKLNFIRGVDSLISGFKACQKDIKEFVNKCEKNTDNSGYLNSDFFSLSKGKNIKFNKGPFINFVSEDMEIQNKKIKLLVGNISIYLDKKENCLLPAE